MTYKYLRLLLPLLVGSIQAFSQKEGNIWHFGKGAALDFNLGTPQVIAPSSMWTTEGSASICDANGNLLFYSNGGGRDPVSSGQSSGKIWNRQHNTLYDMGFGEGGGFSAAQSSVIVPRPGVIGNYYLFTMEEVEFNIGGSVSGQPLGRGLSCFEVDMALNAGLGGVVNYTGLIYTPSYEGLCAVRHANGTDYWIIVHRGDNLGLAIFPVTGLGIGVPLLSTAGFTGGIIKGSPDGKWLSTTSDSGQQLLIPFDAASGTLGTAYALDAYPNFVEFSPNSQRLFVTTDNQVQYFNLAAADINGSKTIVDYFPGFDFSQGFNYIIGQMQLASDGKIYMLRADFSSDSVLLSAIACPNSAPFLEINTIGFYPGPDASFLGLPNFDNAIFRSDENNLIVNLGPDQTVCLGDTVVLNVAANGATYNWSNGAATPSLAITTNGLYAVTVSNGCGTGTDSISINFIEAIARAGADTSICAGSDLQLLAQGVGQLVWSPAEAVSAPQSTMPFFIGTTSTALFLTAIQGACTTTDTVIITVLNTPIAQASPLDTTIIQGSSVVLQGAGIWSPAAGLSCTDCSSPVATPDSTSVYTLTSSNSNGCTDTAQVIVRVIPPDCQVQIPNAFTPNNDGANEDFKPIGNLESYEMQIYNRWGKPVFRGEKPWDGLISAIPAPVDVYLYKISLTVCGEEKMYTGEVTLLR